MSELQITDPNVFTVPETGPEPTITLEKRVADGLSFILDKSRLNLGEYAHTVVWVDELETFYRGLRQTAEYWVGKEGEGEPRQPLLLVGEKSTQLSHLVVPSSGSPAFLGAQRATDFEGEETSRAYGLAIRGGKQIWWSSGDGTNEYPVVQHRVYTPVLEVAHWSPPLLDSVDVRRERVVNSIVVGSVAFEASEWAEPFAEVYEKNFLNSPEV